MVEDPNDSARRAFGDDSPLPSPPAAPPVPAAREAGALAEWGTRAAAYVLDALFLFGAGFLLTIVAAVATGSTEQRALRPVFYALWIPLVLLYAPLLMARRGTANGQTLGKQMMAIRVVGVDGSAIGFWTAFVRQAIAQQLLMTLTLYVYALVDYLWPLRDPRKQALHDKVARTVVRRTAPAGLPRPPGALREPADADVPPATSPRRVDESPVHGWLPPSGGG